MYFWTYLLPSWRKPGFWILRNTCRPVQTIILCFCWKWCSGSHCWHPLQRNIQRNGPQGIYFLYHSIVILHLLLFEKHLGFDSVQGFSVYSYPEGLKIENQKDAIKPTWIDKTAWSPGAFAMGESNLWVATDPQRSSHITDLCWHICNLFFWSLVLFLSQLLKSESQ